MKFFGWILFVLIISGGCGHQTDYARQERKLGINGDAVYVFKKDGKLWGVYKTEYYGDPYQIILKRDTINLGNEFGSLLNVAKTKFKITIESPSNYVITDEETYGMREYKFTPDRVGVYDYKGLIEYDSVRVPFQYKFIVTE